MVEIFSPIYSVLDRCIFSALPEVYHYTGSRIYLFLRRDLRLDWLLDGSISAVL